MNVLIVMFDSLRCDHLAFNGHPYVKTPHFDRFADEAVFFRNAIAEQPITIPSRTAMLTGNFTFTNRTWQPMLDTDTSFIERLTEAGYHTCAMSDSPFNADARVDKGFAEFHWYHGGKCYPPVNPDRVIDIAGVFFTPNTTAKDKQYYANTLSNRAEYMEREGMYFPDIITRDAVNWLETHAEDPDNWLLWLDYFDPHEPWDPPKPYSEMYYPDYKGNRVPMPDLRADELAPDELRHLLAQYDGCVSQVDEQFGQLRASMERLGLWDNTLVLLLSDHGEPFGEHGTVRKHFVPVYDELCRFVYMIRDPESTRKGAKLDALVQNTDLAPTLLRRLGVEPGTMDGVDLNPLLRGETSQAHDAVYSGCYQFRASIRTPEWKFIDNRGEKDNELYNMIDDPAERANLLAKEPQLARKLHRKLWEFYLPWAGDWTWKDRPVPPATWQASKEDA